MATRRVYVGRKVPVEVVIEGTAREATKAAIDEARLVPGDGWDIVSRRGGLLGVVAEAYPAALVRVAGVPASVAWIADEVFDQTWDATWALAFWEAVAERDLPEKIAWWVAARVLRGWGVGAAVERAAAECEWAAVGDGEAEERVGVAVEEVLGFPVVGCESVPRALVRAVLAQFGLVEQMERWRAVGAMLVEEIRKP